MKYFFSSLLLVSFLFSSAQMDLLDSMMTTNAKQEKEYVAYTFKMTRVINGQSVEMTKKGALDFQISHRFGDAFATKADNIHNLFGFDQASDIGITFDYGITVTVDVYGNATISSELNSNDPSTVNYFPKGYAGFSHRLSYLVQGLIATKATSWLSVQLDPTFLWRNNVPSNDKNGMFIMGFSARAKFNKRTAVIFEYYLPGQKSGIGGREPFAMVRGIKNAAYYPALNLGVEFETGGHVFHVNLTNTAGISENDFMAYNAHNWAQGQFRLGFSISRSFPLDKKHKGEKYWKKGSVEDPDQKKDDSKNVQIVR